MDRTHDISVAIHELQEVFQAPAKAAAAAHDRLGELVVILLQLVVDVLKNQPNDAANCDDERAESQSSKMETECSIDGSGKCEERDVILVHRPVPSSETSGEDHFGEGRNEEQQPKESDNVDPLEPLNQLRSLQADVCA